MRDTGICPKCRNNQLVHVGRVADVGHAGGIAEMHLAIVYVGEGFFSESRAVAGKLSAIVCRRCGFTELYVLDPHTLRPDGKYITEVTGPSPSGPFR